ncbi:MAG: class C sortase [Butyricicoccus sp.]|jgi:sortase A
MKKHLPTIVLVLIFCIGLSLLLYPTVSDYWNSLHQSRAISNYADAVAALDNEDYDRILESARNYNQNLAKNGTSWNLTEEQKEEYEKQLCVDDTGIMSYIEIPSIDCSLPIYHGTDEGVLQKAIGHIPGSSLPVGGKSTHCVLSGHRGLPSAKLFTDLDQLKEGETFLLRTLDETLTYQVDQILIVEPNELQALQIEEGEDLCTLVTCTPYGVNSHRLLVRGHRIANQADASYVRVTADAVQIDPVLVAPVVGVPILIILLIGLLARTRKKERNRGECR